MQQYQYEDVYKGKPRKLLILSPKDGTDYRVFCESLFLGTIKHVIDLNAVNNWKTEYNILKPIVQKIGKYIESQDILSEIDK